MFVEETFIDYDVEFKQVSMYSLVEQRDTVNKWMERFGVRFGIYKNGVFDEQLFPFDAVPRTISHTEWVNMEKGLVQRVNALNIFLNDIYHQKQIVKNGVIPEEFIYSSKGYMPECEHIGPKNKIYSHISGIDLVQAKDDSWYILEDNLRIPSGASYPMIARTITRKVSPNTFKENDIADNRTYPSMLRKTMEYVNVDDGLMVILTPGRYNSAFFEHSYLAEKSGMVLAFPGDLVVEKDCVYYKGLFDKKKRVGAIYRRISDEFLDPLVFDSSSLLGVPNLMRAYAKGNVSIVNAPGNGVADDKGIYYFVPKMIEYYLGEKPILQNAPTYLPYFAEDKKYVMENITKLVIKDVAEAGGYGVLFGRDMDAAQLANIKHLIETEPRRWIAQEVIDFKDLEIVEANETVCRKADLRAFVLSEAETKVWKSGLTRFSRNPTSFIVNSSQGGGFKDTWVLNK